MPLLLTALTDTPGLPGAGTNTALADGTAVAAAWAAAVGAWATGIVPASPVVAAAQTALQATLATLFATQRATADDVTALAQDLEAAHLTFATAVGAGMAGFTPTPPTSAVNFADILTADPRETSQAAADAIADALDTWMRTGKSVLVVSPFTAVDWN